MFPDRKDEFQTNSMFDRMQQNIPPYINLYKAEKTKFSIIDFHLLHRVLNFAKCSKHKCHLAFVILDDVVDQRIPLLVRINSRKTLSVLR